MRFPSVLLAFACLVPAIGLAATVREHLRHVDHERSAAL